ncbi:MAG: hypothetical protein HQL95_02340 [Magnetococcales bacterium]|nr:hypothetical protein [Magnetococcales bacterium]
MDDFSIPLVAGDHGRALRFTLRDRLAAAPGRLLNHYDPETWAPCDLTRVVAIRVPVQPRDRSRPPYPLTAMKLAPYTSGLCQMIWPPELFAVPGHYEAEVSLEYAGGAMETVYGRMVFIVKERLR